VVEALNINVDAPTMLRQYMPTNAKVASQRVRKLRGVFCAI
jgi:hypothetical protein